MDAEDDVSDRMLARAVGQELRDLRESKGWSRGQLIARLPSGIGDRTVLSYEHGTRQLTVLRLVELCRALGIAAPTLLTHAFQRARLELATLPLRIDLRHLLHDESPTFRPMRQWARNKLNQCPSGIAEVQPSSLEELANFVGYTHQELAQYLAGFTPEVDRDESSVVVGPWSR